MAGNQNGEEGDFTGGHPLKKPSKKHQRSGLFQSHFEGVCTPGTHYSFGSFCAQYQVVQAPKTTLFSRINRP